MRAKCASQTSRQANGCGAAAGVMRETHNVNHVEASGSGRPVVEGRGGGEALGRAGAAHGTSRGDESRRAGSHALQGGRGMG